MSNFEPDPKVVDIIDKVVEGTADMAKTGKSAVKVDDEFYDEARA